MIVWKVVFFS